MYQEIFRREFSFGFIVENFVLKLWLIQESSAHLFLSIIILPWRLTINYLPRYLTVPLPPHFIRIILLCRCYPIFFPRRFSTSNLLRLFENLTFRNNFINI